MPSDAAWYIERTTGPIQEFYDLFFRICKKHNISWAKASEEEKAFIAEQTRTIFKTQMPRDVAWHKETTTAPIQTFSDMFLDICKKYNVSWDNASNKEKAFVAEVARVTFELETAKRNGAPISGVQPSFCG